MVRMSISGRRRRTTGDGMRHVTGITEARQRTAKPGNDLPMWLPRMTWATGTRNDPDGRSLTGGGRALPVGAVHRPPGSTLRATRGHRRPERAPSRLQTAGALMVLTRPSSPLRETREGISQTSGRTAAITVASHSTSPRRANATMTIRVAPPTGRIGGAGRRLAVAAAAPVGAAAVAAEGRRWTGRIAAGAVASRPSPLWRLSCWVWLGTRASRSPSAWPKSRLPRSRSGGPTRFRTLSGKHHLSHGHVGFIC